MLTARLSENPAVRVLLIQAGRGFDLETAPSNVWETYAGRVMGNFYYDWPEPNVHRGVPGYTSTAG